VAEPLGADFHIGLPDRRTAAPGFGGLHGGVTTALVDAAATGLVAGREGRPARTLSTALRYIEPGLRGPFRADPSIVGLADGEALVRVPLVDEGADDVLIVLAEARVRLADET
jgi:acyl-coenzyme A thioesterase PaaI-like protein